MQVTQLLNRVRAGDPGAMHLLMPLVYHELKRLARANLRRELSPALDTTVLVHEAFVRLVAARHPTYENRLQFFGIASRLMRQVLVDRARAKAAKKRGSAREIALEDWTETMSPEDRSVLALNDALRSLEKIDARKGQLVEMRYFGGMTAEESSIALSIPVHQVRRELRLAQAWLRRELAGTARDGVEGCLNERSAS